jgi:hypothetical protein
MLITKLVPGQRIVLAGETPSYKDVQRRYTIEKDLSVEYHNGQPLYEVRSATGKRMRLQLSPEGEWFVSGFRGCRTVTYVKYGEIVEVHAELETQEEGR